MFTFTDHERNVLIENGKPENRDQNHPPVVKLFLPGSACTWLLSEIDHEEPTIAFGLCDLGFYHPELGSVSLTELQHLRLPVLDLAVEKDEHFTPKYPLSVYAEAARLCAAITEDEQMLRRVAAKQGLTLHP